MILLILLNIKFQNLMIKNLLIVILLDYIYSEGMEHDSMSIKFAEYMIKEIGKNAFQSNIKFSITSLLNIEKRPLVSIFEIMRYIGQMYPKYFSFNGSWFESLRHE